MEKTKGRPFAVFDIDGTLIRWQLYHAIVDELAKLSYIPASDFDDVRKARMKWKQRAPEASFRTYEQELIRVYFANLKNLTTQQLDEAAEAAFQEYKDQVYTYTRDLIRRLKDEGYLIFAISGSHNEIIVKMAAHYGFDDAEGAHFLKKDGKFTGELVTSFHNKDVTLKKLVEKHGSTFSGSFAVGDSFSDSRMMALVTNPVAFNPDAELLEEARKKGWKIVLERKNVIYELEKSGKSYILAPSES
jgi:HAD superfamily hydrolase (TIGR01490 family)